MKEPEVRKIIDTLPQREAIRDCDIAPWIDAAMQDGRAAFHVRRLFGVGGSEGGILVAAATQEMSFSSPDELWEEKLLRRTPDGGSPDTSRGLALEDIVSAISHKTLGAKRNQAAIDAIKNIGADPMSFLIGNPDDVLTLNYAGHVFDAIPDYKVPAGNGAFAIYSEGVPLDYRVQLHIYADRYRAALRKDIGALLLMPFSTDDWRVYPTPVVYDQTLMDLTRECSRSFFINHVIPGVCPAINPFALSASETFTEMRRASIEDGAMADLANEHAMLGALSREVEQRRESVRERMIFRMRELETPVARNLNVAHSSVKSENKTEYAEEKMLDLADQAGIELDEYEVTTVKTDLERLDLALQEAGFSPEQYSKVVDTVRVRHPQTRYKGERGDFARAMEARASSIVDAIASGPGPDQAHQESLGAFAPSRKIRRSA